MVLQTFEHNYPVSSVLETNDIYDCYICLNESEGGFCRIISIKRKELFPEIVSWLTTVMTSAAFTDYIEHFNCDDRLCIAMRYTQGVTLKDKLEMEKPTFAERLEIGRRILERAILQDIPDYFLDKCFSPECIIVAPDLTISFNYPISDIVGTRRHNAPAKITALLRLIFAGELERNIPDELIAFFTKLPELPAEGMISLYSEYYMMMNSVISIDTENVTPKSIWYRLWEKIKKAASVLKKFLLAGLLTGCIVYLIWLLFADNNSRINKPNFDSIGTVIIDKTR